MCSHPGQLDWQDPCGTWCLVASALHPLRFKYSGKDPESLLSMRLNPNPKLSLVLIPEPLAQEYDGGYSLPGPPNLIPQGSVKACAPGTQGPSVEKDFKIRMRE